MMRAAASAARSALARCDESILCASTVAVAPLVSSHALRQLSNAAASSSGPDSPGPSGPAGPASSSTGGDSRRKIDFGFQEVDEDEKERMVKGVFDNVAGKYDVMNDLMSAGLHRQWKDHLVATLRPFPGMRHLDVAGGTGDISFRILDAVSSARGGGQGAEVTVSDINEAMLAEGRRRAQGRSWPGCSVAWVPANAEELPFEDGSFDSYTVAFGIRNVTHRDRALREALRVLRPGGRFLCLEFSHVTVPGLKEFYDLYSFNVSRCTPRTTPPRTHTPRPPGPPAAPARAPARGLAGARGARAAPPSLPLPRRSSPR